MNRRAALIRTVEFSAAHHYRRREWSEEDNARVFGAQSRPHGHDYRVEVEVAGSVHPETGFVVDLPGLDQLLDEVVGGLDQRDLNEAIPEVRDGSMLPSTESLAVWLWERLEARIPGNASLERVRVSEGRGLSGEVSRSAAGGAS